MSFQSTNNGFELAQVPIGNPRPRWSVMIPTFNCAHYLRQTLESVLSQDPGPDQMQIQVVDDVSTKDDPEAVVREVSGGRVEFFRKEANAGAVANFNTCIDRSRGQLIHVLHGDDYVLPGFYKRISDIAAKHPDVGLLACRCFVVDETGVIRNVTPVMPELVNPSNELASFHLGNPLQFAGVVVRRTSYKTNGGFSSELVHTADWEMWSRVIASDGGVVSPEVLACYREFSGNDTSRLMRTAENLRDRRRLYQILTDRCHSFDKSIAAYRLRSAALYQANFFLKSGDDEAFRANIQFWKEVTPLRRRLRAHAGAFVRRILGQ